MERHLQPITVGHVSGRLVVVVYAEKLGAHHYWSCQCRCGGFTKTRAVLLRGKTLSCGCLNVEAVKKSNTKHGEARTGQASAEYSAWRSMLARCLNPKNARFKDWGGRGIKVCKRWQTSYPNFLKDMGRRPSKKHSLDRVDNDGNYTPTNCRWSTSLVQMRNRRKKT